MNPTYLCVILNIFITFIDLKARWNFFVVTTKLRKNRFARFESLIIGERVCLNNNLGFITIRPWLQYLQLLQLEGILKECGKFDLLQ